MTQCNYCGDEIEFRYVDGRCVPIHLSGRWCQGNNNRISTKFDNSSNNRSTSFADLCRPTTCPKCGNEVFFIRHNGGSVWVDDLGWPWPKHSCMYTNEKPSWYANFEKIEPPKGGKNHFIGVIVKSRLYQKSSCIILAIDGGRFGRLILAVKPENTTKYFENKLVVVNFEKDVLIIVETHDVKPILRSGIDPEIIGLPSNWMSS